MYGDDDKSFVGNLSETALFTPASDGPNPERKFSRNNYGDVWVVAKAKNEKDKEGQPLTGKVVPGCYGSDLYQMGPTGGEQVTATATRRVQAGRVSFLRGGRTRASCIWFRLARCLSLTTPPVKLIDRVARGETAHEELMEELVANGYSYDDAEELIDELYHSSRDRVGRYRLWSRWRIRQPISRLQSLVMNLTNQCNLSCTYCYEFGEDKVATPEGKPKFMDMETAKASVDFLLAQSANRKSVHITFFGGETLMNFPLLEERGRLRH